MSEKAKLVLMLIGTMLISIAIAFLGVDGVERIGGNGWYVVIFVGGGFFGVACHTLYEVLYFASDESPKVVERDHPTIGEHY